MEGLEAKLTAPMCISAFLPEYSRGRETSEVPCTAWFGSTEDHGELRSLAHVTTSSPLPEVGTDLSIWKEDQTALGLKALATVGTGHKTV